MSHGDRIKLHLKRVTNDQQHNIFSFRSYSDADEDEIGESHEILLSKILSGRDVIIVTKGAQLIDLVSDSVDPTDKNYVTENAMEISTFRFDSSSYDIHATLLKKMPLNVAKDLATSSEFEFGNLWFLIPTCGDDLSERSQQVINDSRTLAPSAFDEFPALCFEAVILPAMYDGLEVLWFKPDHDVYENEIKPLFEN